MKHTLRYCAALTKRTEQTTTLKLLQWLVYSVLRLTAKEFAEAFAVDIDDNPQFNPEKPFEYLQHTLLISPSLIDIDKAEWDIRLAHFSRISCLGEDSSRASPLILVDVSVAEACLVCFLEFDVPELGPAELLREFLLAYYVL